MSYPEKVQDYLDRMTVQFYRLPEAERAEYLRWERSSAHTRDSDWPGWAKYLGPRPRREEARVS